MSEQFRKKTRVGIPKTTPSPKDIKIQQDNIKLIHWLESLKNRRF